MSDETSALLGLPYIQAAQAQKHVTHNEALRMLDVLVQANVSARGLNTPPSGPAEGDRYIVGPAPTGDWADHAQEIALYETGVWQFYAPSTGWRVYVIDEGVTVAFDGTAWSTAEAPTELGINTAADSTNRLAVSAEATLLTHEGAGHQLKINKANQGETASLLFQSAFVGRAEMGLAGDNDFSIKVYDGSTWINALTFDRNTGLASGDAVQANATDTTVGRLARADFAYSPGNLLGTVSQSGGVPTGAIFERGSNTNGRYVRWADGTQLCQRTVTIDATSTTRQDFSYPAAFVGVDSGSWSYSNDNPNSAIRPANMRSFGAFTAQWSVRHVSSGTNPSPTTSAEQLRLEAWGRWF